MTTETTRETINKIQNADSMRAVKVALELSEANQKSVSKVMEVVSLLDKNIKELATKVIKLERAWDLLESDLTKLDKKLESVMDQLERFA